MKRICAGVFLEPAYQRNKQMLSRLECQGHFLRREAGYDNNLPPDVNGHDEFAAYWTQEIISKKPALAAYTLQI